MKRSKKRKKLAKVLFRLTLLAITIILTIWFLWLGIGCLMGRSGNTESVNLFFYDDIIGTLSPTPREVDNENIPENAIRALIDGPLERENVLAVLNPETKLRSINIKDKIATIDLSTDIRTLINSAIPEKEIAYSIINTLLLLPGIDNVQFLINGERPSVLSETFDVSGMFSELFDSSPSIHEYYLYYPERKNRYIVCETTKIKEAVSTEELAELLTRRYIQGAVSTKLSSPLNSLTKVLGTTFNQSQLTINFSKEILQSNMSAEGETAFLKTLVWTLTELSGVKRVQILLEGNQVVSLFGHHSYREPFSRWDESRLVDVSGEGIPVMVYYSCELDDGQYALVPRLKYISVAGEVLPQVLNILLSGPDATELENTITTCINSGITGKVEIEGNTIKLSLDTNNELNEIKDKAYERMFIEQIIMTLTERQRDSGVINISFDGAILDTLPYSTIVSGDLMRGP